MSAMMLILGAVHADVYIDDDFASYATTAEMQAVWGAAGAGSLSTTFGYGGGQSMQHPAGADNTFALAADLIPTDANPVVLREKCTMTVCRTSDSQSECVPSVPSRFSRWAVTTP